MIRRALAPDADAIAALHAAMFDDGWRQRDIASLLNAPSGAAYLACSGVAAQGFIIGRIVAGEAEILSLGVTANARRCGLGRALLAALTAAAREGGARTLFLDVAADNAAALAFYRRSGFATIATRRGYYHRPGNVAVDAACMALDI